MSLGVPNPGPTSAPPGDVSFPSHCQPPQLTSRIRRETGSGLSLTQIGYYSTMVDKVGLINQLRQRLEDVPVLEGEEHFTTDSETLARFLKARLWSLDEAEKVMRTVVEWRRRNKPLTMDCTWCHQQAGFHSMRQIGHDEQGRPVVYASFKQVTCHRNLPEDAITHVIHLIENAKRTMPTGVHQWVWVLDCNGMTLPACNPRLGYEVTQVLGRIYPERLAMVICLNHSSMFHGVWKAIKVFLNADTVAKMKLVKSKKKIRETFSQFFSAELTKWLVDEIELNKKKLNLNQREFWKGPKDPFAHDPRGTPSYIQDYVDTFHIGSRKNKHLPHPNIVDYLSGKELRVPSPVDSPIHTTKKDSGDSGNESDSETGSTYELPEQYKLSEATVSELKIDDLNLDQLNLQAQ